MSLLLNCKRYIISNISDKTKIALPALQLSVADLKDAREAKAQLLTIQSAWLENDVDKEKKTLDELEIAIKQVGKPIEKITFPALIQRLERQEIEQCFPTVIHFRDKKDNIIKALLDCAQALADLELSNWQYFYLEAQIDIILEDFSVNKESGSDENVIINNVRMRFERQLNEKSRDSFSSPGQVSSPARFLSKGKRIGGTSTDQARKTTAASSDGGDRSCIETQPFDLSTSTPERSSVQDFSPMDKHPASPNEQDDARDFPVKPILEKIQTTFNNLIEAASKSEPVANLKKTKLLFPKNKKITQASETCTDELYAYGLSPEQIICLDQEFVSAFQEANIKEDETDEGSLETKLNQFHSNFQSKLQSTLDDAEIPVVVQYKVKRAFSCLVGGIIAALFPYFLAVSALFSLPVGILGAYLGYGFFSSPIEKSCNQVLQSINDEVVQRSCIN